MAKITAVIDIGSNSVRMLVFKKTSRYGFYLLKEAKSRVRISEHSYQNGGMLQEPAMLRAEKTIGGFAAIAHSLHARKIICVATSAVRDAPNKNEFLKRIHAKTGISIKVIDGQKESHYGGIAALNLLPIEDGVTVDIGGGSTELALIKNGRIEDTISFQLGTVRLKELFFDSAADIETAREYVQKQLEALPAHFCDSRLIGIGGTLRALAQALIKKEGYALNILHAYEYKMDKNREFFEAVIATEHFDRLKKLGFKQDRFDVIREGLLIFTEIARKVAANDVITSGVGVREGVFLSDLLRSCNGIFPHGFNPSIRSLMDRFEVDAPAAAATAKLALQMFDELQGQHRLDDSLKRYLVIAARLADIGVFVNYYKKSLHAYNIIFEGLDYGFTHKERVLIAKLVRNQQKKVLSKYDPQNRLDKFLPPASDVRWLSFMLYVARKLNADKRTPVVQFVAEEKRIVIKVVSGELYLAEESLLGTRAPGKLNVEFFRP